MELLFVSFVVGCLFGYPGISPCLSITRHTNFPSERWLAMASGASYVIGRLLFSLAVSICCRSQPGVCLPSCLPLSITQSYLSVREADVGGQLLSRVS